MAEIQGKDFKTGKIMIPLKEFQLQEGTLSYEINGIANINVTYFIRENYGVFEVLPKGDYSLQSSGDNIIITFNQSVWDNNYRECQVCSTFALESSIYTPDGDPDINTMLNYMNNLATDVANLVTYFKAVNTIMDTASGSNTLGALKPNTTWYMNSEGLIVSMPVNELFEGFNRMVQKAYEEILKKLTVDYENFYRLLKEAYELYMKNMQELHDQLTTEYNNNHEEKLKIYNDNHEEKLNKYNQNDAEKTDAYNKNHETKLNEYNTNADNRMSEYEQNHTDSMNEYNTNADKRLKEYNDNDTAKTNAYNQNHETKLKAYNDNADTRFNEYEENHTKRLGEYNSNADTRFQEYEDNHIKRLKEYNDNADTRLSEYNTNDKEKTDAFNQNAEQKTNDFNTNASDATTAFDNNATQKTNDFNSNATTKTNEYNTNAEEKFKAYEDNHTKRLGEYNTNADTRLKEYNDNATEKTNSFNSNSDEKQSQLNAKFEEYRAALEAMIGKLPGDKGVMPDNQDWHALEYGTYLIPEYKDTYTNDPKDVKLSTETFGIVTVNEAERTDGNSSKIIRFYTNEQRYIFSLSVRNTWTDWKVLTGDFTLWSSNIAQAGHGFTVNAVNYDGDTGQWRGAINQPTDAIAIRIDDDNFKLVLFGDVQLPEGAVDTDGETFVLDEYYWLDPKTSKLSKNQTMTLIQCLGHTIMYDGKIALSVMIGQAFDSTGVPVDPVQFVPKSEYTEKMTSIDNKFSAVDKQISTINGNITSINEEVDGIKTDYVKKTGDTITGNLTVNGTTTLGTTVSGTTTTAGLTTNGNYDLNGNADISGTLNVTSSAVAKSVSTDSLVVRNNSIFNGNINASGVEIVTSKITASTTDTDNLKLAGWTFTIED